VSHISEINNVLDAITVIFQNSAQNIFENVSSQIADVGVPINRRAATIHAHLFVFEGFKNFFLAGESVVKANRHLIRIFN
jgi:hypothetical protein